MNFGSACADEGSSYLRDSAAGGADIIDHKNYFAVYHRRIGLKSAFEIYHAELPAQFLLRSCTAYLFHCITAYGDVQLAAYYTA